MEIKLSFADLVVDGKHFNKDVIILYNGEIIKRPKELSKPLADLYNHTPFSINEAKKILELLGDTKKLIIGTGLNGRMAIQEGALDVLKSEGIKVEVYKSQESIKRFLEHLEKGEKVALLIHITC